MKWLNLDITYIDIKLSLFIFLAQIFHCRLTLIVKR